MWRIALFIGLFCSVVLNVYLFMQLNLHMIEEKFPQAASLFPQQPTKQINENRVENKAIENTDAIVSIDSPENVLDLVNKIKKAINEKDYINAGYLISSLANEHKAEFPEVKLYWLQATKRLIEQKSFNYAENSIDVYLAFNSDDSDFLYQQVDFYWQQQLFLQAIKHAYEVKYHLYNETEIRNAINFARGLVQQQVEILIKKSDWLALRDLVEEVMVFDSQDLNLQWYFVRAQYQLGEFEYARNGIEALLNQPNYKVKAQLLLADIEAALRSPQSIALSRQGEHFIVQALINESFNVSLMLDTGASISLLSERAFDELNQYSTVAYLKDITLNTAGGQITASLYQAAEFSIADYRVNDFIFAVSPFASEGNDGLLGMNFLSVFDFHIDQKNNRLILKDK